MIINQLKAKKILNSAGRETVECWLETDQGGSRASVPQGISRGRGEKETVSPDKGIEEIEKEILPRIKKKDLTQESLDRILEAGGWGSNATLAVSAAFFKLNNPRIRIKKRPKVMMLIFEGEKHGSKELTIQEFMVIVNQVEEGIDFYQRMEKHLEERGIITTVGKEGGFSPEGLKDEDILNLLINLGAEDIALDVAGNINPPTVSTLLDIVRRFPVSSLEDPFPENKPVEWKDFFIKAKEVNPDIQIVADDLTVTDADKIRSGAEEKLFDGVIIKPNQQGTITAAKKAMATARELGLKTIVSHRGEETNDTWIVDFALRYQADFVKFGAPSRGERVAKYNRLTELVKG